MAFLEKARPAVDATRTMLWLQWRAPFLEKARPAVDATRTMLWLQWRAPFLEKARPAVDATRTRLWLQCRAPFSLLNLLSPPRANVAQFADHNFATNFVIVFETFTKFSTELATRDRQ